MAEAKNFKKHARRSNSFAKAAESLPLSCRKPFAQLLAGSIDHKQEEEDQIGEFGRPRFGLQQG